MVKKCIVLVHLSRPESDRADIEQAQCLSGSKCFNYLTTKQLTAPLCQVLVT